MTALKYFGGKSTWYKNLLPYIPDEQTCPLFRSVFLGAGGLEFNIQSYGRSEIWNDIDGSLVNFYQILQSPDTFKSLQELLDLTLFSEVTFNAAKTLSKTPLEYFGPSVHRAAAFFIRNRMSRGGAGKDFATSTSRLRRNMNENVSAWLSAVDGLPEFHNRIKYVEIRKMHFREFVPKFDHRDAFFYADPCYLPETRVAGKYDFEMTAEEHGELLQLLSNIEGKFMLHGYASSLYSSFETLNKWNRVEFEIKKSSSSSKVKPISKEIIWMNY